MNRAIRPVKVKSIEWYVFRAPLNNLAHVFILDQESTAAPNRWHTYLFVACVLINRIDRSMASILSEFLEEEMTVERIEEPAALPVRHYHAAWEATTGEAGTREAFGKVWIDGIGYMRDGRRLRDGREKADSRKLYRDRTVYRLRLQFSPCNR